MQRRRKALTQMADLIRMGRSGRGQFGLAAHLGEFRQQSVADFAGLGHVAVTLEGPDGLAGLAVEFAGDRARAVGEFGNPVCTRRTVARISASGEASIVPVKSEASATSRVKRM